jgi:pimeloyl-ACP methyl ester carboxylesterase
LAEKIQNVSIRQFLLKNLVRNKNGSFKWKINLEVIDQSIRDLIVEISSDTPFNGYTLFIAGQKSDYIRPVDEEQIFELFPNATIKYLPRVNHWVHAQAPDLLFQTVMEFTHSK